MLDFDDNQLKCPYCNAVQMHHTDEIDCDFANVTCDECENKFHYSVAITYSYNSWTDEEEDRRLEK